MGTYPKEDHPKSSPDGYMDLRRELCFPRKVTKLAGWKSSCWLNVTEGKEEATSEMRAVDSEPVFRILLKTQMKPVHDRWEILGINDIF